MNKKPRGRPKKATTLDAVITFRLASQEKADFIKAAGGANKLKAWILDACRKALLAKDN